MFIITIYKDSRKVKINWNYVSKCTLYPYFLIWQYLLIYREKMLIPAEFKGCVMWFIYFLDLLWVKHNCATFHHCRICLTDFRDGAPSIREQPRKSPSWIGLKVSLLIILLYRDTFSVQVALMKHIFLTFSRHWNTGLVSSWDNLIPWREKVPL